MLDDGGDHAVPGHLEGNLLTDVHDRRVDLDVSKTSGTPDQLAQDRRSLAVALQARYDSEHDEKDLEECIELLRLALEAPNPTTLASAVTVELLSFAIDRRYECKGRLEDLDAYIDLRRQLVEMRQRGHYDSFFILANALCDRYRRTSQSKDLEEAIDLYQEAEHLIPAEQDIPDFLGPDGDLFVPPMSERGLYLSNYAAALLLRHDYSGAKLDMDRSISMAEEALSLFDSSSPDKSLCMTNLASGLRNRFLQLGQVVDLDRSIELYQGALDHSDSFRVVVLTNLANALHLRFYRFAEAKDIGRAIDYTRDALVLRPIGNPSRSGSLYQCGLLHYDRYLLLGGIEDLDEAEKSHGEALSLRPPGHLDRLTSLQGVAACRYSRYLKQGSTQELRNCIELYDESLVLCPRGHPDRPGTLTNLSTCILAALSHPSELSVAPERALALLEEALDIYPPQHPDRAWCLANTAWLYLHPQSPCRDLDRALDYLRSALGSAHIVAQRTLSEALRILNALHEDKPWRHPAFHATLGAKIVESYHLLISHLPKVAYLGLHVEERLHVLAQSQGCAVDGAAYALQIGQPRHAVEILEAGRAVFWSQALQLRTPFDNLPAHLSSELRALSRQLQTISRSTYAGKTHATKPEDVDAAAARARRLTERFDALLADARRLPGCAELLRPPTYAALAEAAERGPIVLLIAGRMSCHAAVIGMGAEPLHVPLSVSSPGLTRLASQMRTAVAHSRAPRPATHKPTTSKDVLQELWVHVVRPIVAALGLSKATGRARPRLWWCATGQFTFLPVHAAGVYNARGAADCCSDYFVSSYTPTLSALLGARASRHRATCHAASVLLAGVPNPNHAAQRWNPLPFTIKEVQAVRDALPPEAVEDLPVAEDCTQDPAAGVTIAGILERLPTASILHLACHGQQNASQPLESGFALQDGMLTVARLMELDLSRAFLAVLSACETAKGDSTQPDQAVHLAAAMLFTGFCSVIATLWPMNDTDGPTVAKHVYSKLFAGDRQYLEADDVAYALDEAIHSLREGGVAASRWATFVHLGA